MFLTLLVDVIYDILIFLIIFIVFLSIGSIFIIRDLKSDFKKVFRNRSKFHIEIRKTVNLMYNIYGFKELEPFTKVVIKNLPHEQKKILIKIIDQLFQKLDINNSENKYIIETYENLQKIRRKRDALVIVYNQKIETFPFSIYAKLMKFRKFDLYTYVDDE